VDKLPDMFGDSLDPLVQRYEHPAVIKMAYDEYVNTTTKPAIDYYDAYGPHYSTNVELMSLDEFHQTGQHKQWIPLLKKDRSTLEAIAESTRRNANRINLEQSVKETRMKGQDPTPIYQELEKDDMLNFVDPVEGVLPGAAGILGGMWEVASQEGAIGASAGLVAGAVAAAPTGELAAPITATAGAAAGLTAGTTYGWYKQGSGALSYEMWKRGIPEKTAGWIADTAAIPYAFIEYMQFGKLIPAKFKQGAVQGLSNFIIKRWPDIFTKILPQAGKEYGKTLVTEVGTEHLQDAVNMFATDLGDYLNDNGVTYDKELIQERAKQFFENTKTYTKSFALLPIVGTAMNTYANTQVDMTDFADMNIVGMSPEQLNSIVTPEIANAKEQKIAILSRMADATPEEFNKSYNALSPQEQKELITELEKSKQVKDVVEETGTSYPTQDDVDKAVGAFVSMNQAKQISPVVLTDKQLDNVQNNIESVVMNEQQVRDKAYIKGFAARLTVISNTADNMVVGAGKPEQQVQVLKDELKSVVDSYANISDLIDRHPETLKELAEIKKLIPSYEKAVNDFIAKPTKEGYKNIRTIGKQIAELGNQYADRVSREKIEAFPKEETGQIQETPEIPMTSVEKAQEEKIVHRVVSRFPAKIKDQKSLETVGNLIAKDLGIKGEIEWVWDLRPHKRNLGTHWDLGGDKHRIRIRGAVGRSQSQLKKTIVHELGHIAKPPVIGESLFGVRSHRDIHHKEFNQWVSDNIDRLMGYWDKGVVVPGKMKTDIETIENNQDREDLSDVIGGGQEIAPDGTVAKPVTDQEAIDALKLMLSEFKDASKDRQSEIKRLRARQYATMQNIMGKFKGSEKFTRAMGAMKDVVADISFDWTHPISDAVFERLCDMIGKKYKDSFRQITTFKALSALRLGHSLTFSEKQALAGAFNLTPDQIPTGSKKYSLADILIEAWNLPRMLLAGFFDNSMLLRQMFPALLDSPIIWAKAAGKSFAALFSPKYVQRRMAEIYNSPNFEMYQTMGIDITSAGAGVESAEEAALGGSFLKYLPHLEQEGWTKRVLKSLWNVSTSGFRASMRGAYISTNTFRTSLADWYIAINKGQLSTITVDGKKQWQYLGNHINRLTGRTNMGGNVSLKKISAVLNPALFSLQLQASRIGLLTSGTRATGDRLVSLLTGGKYQGKYNPLVRRAISNSFLKMAMTMVGVVTLCAYLWPEAVGDDPEQSSYGKVKIGNTYYDLTAGFGQYARFVAQMITGRKRSVTGNRYAVGRGEILKQFARSKSSPSVNLLWDYFSGRKVTGEPVDWTTKEGIFTNLWNYFGPMIMQDTVDVLKNNPYQAVPAVMLAFMGGGVQSYPLMPSQQAVIMKKKLSMETFGKDWDELGPGLQKTLYAVHPELEEQDRIVKATRNDWNSISLRTTESQLAGKKVMQALPQNVQEELIGLNLTIGGLSRQVGSSSYFLNEQKFESYNEYTTTLLNELLPAIIDDPDYQTLDRESRYKMLEVLIQKCKKAARNVILEEVKQSDLVTLQGMQ
jgi:hypothetical protein